MGGGMGSFVGQIIYIFLMLINMKDNIYNSFYSKKTLYELIEQLKLHRITGNTLKEDWYQALIVHLSERNLLEKERKLIEYILSTDPKILEKEKEEKDVNTSKTYNYVITNPDKIVEAGASLKNMVYLIAVMIFCLIGSVLFLNTQRDLEAIKNTYIFMSFIGIVCNVSVLVSLYAAGDNLENSVTKTDKFIKTDDLHK